MMMPSKITATHGRIWCLKFNIVHNYISYPINECLLNSLQFWCTHFWCSNLHKMVVKITCKNPPTKKKHTSKTGKFHKITWKIRLAGIWKKRRLRHRWTAKHQYTNKIIRFCSRFMDDVHETWKSWKRKILHEPRRKSTLPKPPPMEFPTRCTNFQVFPREFLIHLSKIIFLHSSYAVKPHGLSIGCCLSYFCCYCCRCCCGGIMKYSIYKESWIPCVNKNYYCRHQRTNRNCLFRGCLLVNLQQYTFNNTNVFNSVDSTPCRWWWMFCIKSRIFHRQTQTKFLENPQIFLQEDLCSGDLVKRMLKPWMEIAKPC